jgi:hypothetical protein
MARSVENKTWLTVLDYSSLAVDASPWTISLSAHWTH